MASSVTLEYLQSIQGAPNGISTLDSTGKIPASQIPPTMHAFYGNYTALADLQAAYPTAEHGCYAYVGNVKYFYSAADSAWTSSEITASAYGALTQAQKDAVPEWSIIPG
jgi:hypothetical protein